MPLVSVLMAVYNADRYVATTIESILAQSWTDFELIIINDGSTDRSASILDHYASQDARLRVLHRENQGIPCTRNQLVRLAEAELLAWIDADDVALPDRLALQVEFMQQHPAVVCLGSSFELIDARGRRLTHLQVPLTDMEIQPQLLAGHAALFQPCAMLRRSVVQQVGGYDESMGQAEDLDLWLRLGEVGQLANLPHCLIQYRLHADSVSEQDCQFQRQKALEACQRAWQRRGIQGQFEAGEPWRPSSDRRSQQQFILKYGWWAFNYRQRRTALIYGLKAIIKLPLNRESWRLFGCALLKPLRDPLPPDTVRCS
jgi:glycosyltransferase involved in cell wall biosynthesis